MARRLPAGTLVHGPPCAGKLDRGRARACDTLAVPHLPTRYPVSAPPLRRRGLAPALYPVVAGRVPHESPRDLAAECGVSHETIRQLADRTWR